MTEPNIIDVIRFQGWLKQEFWCVSLSDALEEIEKNSPLYQRYVGCKK